MRGVNACVDALPRFRDHALSRGLSPDTAVAYLGHLRRFFEWLRGTYGSADIKAATPLDVADYRRSMQGKYR
ncbi:MAG: site-specific integrase [Thermacetogeniaceae bacterium]